MNDWLKWYLSESGLGGPLISINKSDQSDGKLIFCVGLLKTNNSGHYQFIYFDQEGETVPFKRPTNFFSKPRRNNETEQSSTSPVKNRRSSIINKYLKSPSPKKTLKNSHCNFCSFIANTGQEFEVHLSNSKICRSNYIRNFKINSIESLSVKLFNCMFCNITGNIRLTPHLRNTAFGCIEKYFKKFNVASIEELSKLLEKHRRKFLPSRSKAAARIEYSSKKSSKEDKERCKTMTDLLNDFRRAIKIKKVNILLTFLG